MADMINGSVEKLLEQVKDKCRITWEDPSTERIIKDEIIPSACSIIRFKIGIPEDMEFDFTASGIEHRLFINYCYYAWHDAEDDFETNYSADVAHARRIWEVKADAQGKETASELP